MTGDPISISDPHSWAKDSCEVKSSESKAAETCQEQVDAKNFGEIESWLSCAGVLPDLEIPECPVPNSGEHEQATENNVCSGDTFKAPEAGIHA